MLNATTTEEFNTFYPSQSEGFPVVRKEKSPLRGTIPALAFSAIGLAGIMMGGDFGATYTSTVSIENDSSYVKSSYISSIILSGYSFEDCNFEEIENYLSNRPIATSLLYGLRSIVNKVYKGEAQLKISFPQDPDRGMRVVSVTILSNLPIDSDFKEKDQLLYDELQRVGLMDGLRYVIISQG